MVFTSRGLSWIAREGFWSLTNLTVFMPGSRNGSSMGIAHLLSLDYHVLRLVLRLFRILQYHCLEESCAEFCQHGGNKDVGTEDTTC